MKLVIRSAVFHLFCIIIFALIYFYFAEHFQSNKQNIKYNDFTDYLLLSTTIQAGVGLTELYPISSYSKMLLMLQQLILILTHIITLYIFTL
jgi:hypothetical protein